MKWIIFQAVPPTEEHYQMYVARLHLAENQPAKIDPPIRISPQNSRNTCGYFSPDGAPSSSPPPPARKKKEDPSGGYQRQGRSYVWSFPTGMENLPLRQFPASHRECSTQHHRRSRQNSHHQQ